MEKTHGCSRFKNSNSWRKTKPVLIPKDISELDKIKNNVTCLLNKLAPTNFDPISIKLIDVIKINNILDHCVNEIFLKAVYQPVYCPYYVKLLLLFSKKHYEIDTLLSDMCEKFTNIISGTKKIINNNETYDEFSKSNKLKSVFLENNSHFFPFEIPNKLSDIIFNHL